MADDRASRKPSNPTRRDAALPIATGGFFAYDDKGHLVRKARADDGDIWEDRPEHRDWSQERLRKRIFFAPILISSLFAARMSCVPFDLVEARLEQVPTQVRTIYLLAIDDEVASPMGWYVNNDLIFRYVDPKFDECWRQNAKGDRWGKVRWRSAGAHGILAETTAGDWVAWTLEPELVDGPPLRRYFWGGGQGATIQALGIESAEPAPKALIDRVTRD